MRKGKLMRHNKNSQVELRIPLKRQPLDTGLEFNFLAHDAAETESNLLILSLALAQVQPSDGLATAARMTAYALGRFADRQGFPSIPALAQDTLRASHPLHPRPSTNIRIKAESLLNEAHRFLSGYRDHAANSRIYDIALIVIEAIEYLARDVIGVWITWFGLDERFKPIPYWREPQPQTEPVMPAKRRYIEPAALLAAGILAAGFLLTSCSTAHLWRVLGCILSVLCMAAAPIRLYICLTRTEAAAVIPHKAR
jgi:hypothetical protein